MVGTRAVCATPMSKVAIAMGVAFGSLGIASNVSAENVTKYDQITMIVSSSPGGGTDIVARLLGDAMEKHLPGKPNTIYRHLPAAGGLASLNYFYSQAKPDGRTYYIGAGNQLNPVNLRSKKVEYDPKQLRIIGAFVNPSSFLVLRKEAEGRLGDRSGSLVHMAAFDGTRSGEQIAVWGAEVLKWNIKLVYGYRGTAAMSLALQRGEVDMMTNNNAEVIKPLVERGEANFVTQTGMLSNGKVVPSDMFPDVPIFATMLGNDLNGRAKAAFNLWQRSAQIGKWFALPPKTPDAIVEAYRQAFKKAAANSQFKKMTNVRVSPDFKEMTVADMEQLIEDMAGASDDALEFLAEVRERYRKR